MLRRADLLSPDALFLRDYLVAIAEVTVPLLGSRGSVAFELSSEIEDAYFCK